MGEIAEAPLRTCIHKHIKVSFILVNTGSERGASVILSYLRTYGNAVVNENDLNAVLGVGCADHAVALNAPELYGFEVCNYLNLLPTRSSGA